MRILLLCFFLLSSAWLQAQKAEEKCTVLSAMKDELLRGYENLTLPGHPKAFYLFSRINEIKTFRLYATMGSLTTSVESGSVSLGNLRILSGNYDFNDESLNHPSEQSRRIQADLPEDTTDYMGIRRSLWISMERIFVGAAKGMTKNEETIKQKGLTIDKVPHRSFGKVSPVKLVKSFSPELPDKSALTMLVKKWSDSLGRVPGAISSGVNLYYTRGYNYMYSTEGLTSRLPYSLASLSMSVDCKNSLGMQVNQRVQLYARSSAKLTDEKWIAEQLSMLKKNIVSIQQSKDLDEPYSGPVLFMDEAVANVFFTALNDYQEPVTYSNEIDDDNENMYVSRRRIRQPKIGSILTHQNISIKINPLRREFEGKELLGAFELDDEGTPPVPFTLIESGAIKELFNDRTLTDPGQPVNGYSHSIGGVVEVSVKAGEDAKSLRTKLLDEVKRQGLEFGIVYRLQSGGFVTMYKVFANDGHEEILTPSRMPPISMKSLKKFIGASSKTSVFNIRGIDPLRTGDLTSFIVPDAMLIGEIDIGVMEYRRKAQPDFLPAPDDKK